MKYLSISTVLLLILLSCDDNISVTIEQFSYSEGQKFNYEYTYSLDENDSIQVVDSGIFVLEVISTSAQIGSYSNLIEFKVYNKNTPEIYSKSWYQQSSNGFYDVAYQNPGIDPGIQPKEMFRKKISFPQIALPTLQLTFEFYENDIHLKRGSIIVRDEIRLTAPLPLNLGTKSWTEFTTPFTRKSVVTGVELIETNNHTENTLEVTASFGDSFFNDLELYSYFNQKGLIKRIAISKNQEITSDDGEFIEYLDSITEITLID